MAERSFWRTLVEGIYNGLGNEYVRALEGARHELVDRAWFGRSPFEQWAGIGPAQQSQGDALGRTATPPAVGLAEHEPAATMTAAVETDPQPTHSEREATATAYARHQQAGPLGLMELEDVQTREQSAFEQWVGLPAAQPAQTRETERTPEPPGLDIER